MHDRGRGGGAGKNVRGAPARRLRSGPPRRSPPGAVGNTVRHRPGGPWAETLKQLPGARIGEIAAIAVAALGLEIETAWSSATNRSGQVKPSNAEAALLAHRAAAAIGADQIGCRDGWWCRPRRARRGVERRRRLKAPVDARGLARTATSALEKLRSRSEDEPGRCSELLAFAPRTEKRVSFASTA